MRIRWWSESTSEVKRITPERSTIAEEKYPKGFLRSITLIIRDNRTRYKWKGEMAFDRTELAGMFLCRFFFLRSSGLLCKKEWTQYPEHRLLLEKLLTKRKEMESKELLKAFSESKKTLAEVLDFLREAETGEEQDNQ